MVIHSLWITDTGRCVVAFLRGGDLAGARHGARVHHGLAVGLPSSILRPAPSRSEMALAEANRFIAGCQQFCNIAVTVWLGVYSMVTGVNPVAKSGVGSDLEKQV